MSPLRALALLGVGLVGGCLTTLDLDELQQGCPVGQKECDGTCVATDDPTLGCATDSCEPCPGPANRLACDESGACAVAPCPTGEKSCDGVCVSITDPTLGCAGEDCSPCPGPEERLTCDASGACALKPCPSDEKSCAGLCVAVTDPDYGCGATSCEPCSIAHGTARCASDGRCVAESCVSRYKVCDETCVSVTSPTYGCNAIGCEPCALPYATSTCSAIGVCAIAACDNRRGNCDRDDRNGCETNLNEDVLHCGECNRACTPLANAEVTCGNANCVVRYCNPGWGDCDKVQSNGCEVDLRTSLAHCGACQKPCAAGQTCVAGACEGP